MLTTEHNPHSTDPRTEASKNILWSVMIPTYRPNEKYLRKAIQSVIQQDFSPERMQIGLVDNGSSGVNVSALVHSIAGNRVELFRIPKNIGLVGGFNFCIEQAKGEWVHILCDDDYILPGFYQTLAQAAETHPEVGLLATRSFFVDTENIITGVSPRLQSLEHGGRAVEDFFYATPIECPAVAVKKSFYEAHGGFRSDLNFVLDCEMWARVISVAGGLVTPDVLSCHRLSAGSESGRLFQTAEDLRDLERLNVLFAERHLGFDPKTARQRVCNRALYHAEDFAKAGNFKAAKANLDYWKEKAPLSLRLRRLLRQIAKKCLG